MSISEKRFSLLYRSKTSLMTLSTGCQSGSNKRVCFISSVACSMKLLRLY